MSASDSAIAMTVTQIGNTPKILELLLAGVPAEDMSWKPQPSRYSVAEVLTHLAHVDANCFAPRIQHVIEQDNPALPEYDDGSFMAAGHDFVSDGPARLQDF